MPTFDPIETDSIMTAERVWEAYTSKYVTAGNYAVWAHTLLETNLKDLRAKLEQDDITPALADLLALANAMSSYIPGTVSDYDAPTAPTYTAIPSYSAPTLGTLLDIPTIDPIVIPDAPSSAISFTNSAFSDELLTSLKSKLSTDLGSGSTGLGSAEAALFARETARQNAVRAAAYTEITTQFSSRGFDMPTGALLAKQTEINNESGIRLSDSSSQIMAESARLALDYNKHVLSVCTQLEDMLGRLNDSKIMRDFEAAKTTVQLNLEGFKTVVEGLLGEANIQKTAVEATIAANEGTVKVFMGKIEGQTAPMKAIAETNHAQASAYSAAVSGASANVQASALPEELKIKQQELELKTVGVKADIVGKTATMAIESALRETTTSVETLKAMAIANAQMIASSWNTVSASASIGYGANASNNYSDASLSEQQNRKDVAMIAKTGHT